MSEAAEKGTKVPLQVKTLEFLGPMAQAGGWRPDPTLPEIAIAGRSNVGKSSLLNKLVQRKGMARVSHTPGRTREINFFSVNDVFVLADLPGYGYARISKERREEWKPLIEGFLRTSAKLAGLVLLLDARRDPTPEDRIMIELLAEIELPTLFVATKIDKLKPKERADRIGALAAVIGTESDQVIPFSSVTNEGRDDLAGSIEALLAQPNTWRQPVATPGPSASP
jgi:GTP-binding protein